MLSSARIRQRTDVIVGSYYSDVILLECSLLGTPAVGH